MGNDGGSIPGRAELVRPKQKEVRVESDLVKRARAKFCALTKERLKRPVAVCRVGLLKAFLDKAVPQEFNHIKKLKDVRELNLSDNIDKTSEFPFMCSVSQNVMNGKNRFIALWSCGCVFDEKVIREFGIKIKKCPSCGKKYEQKDIVLLGITNEVAEYKRARLLEEQNEKKQKSVKQQFDDSQFEKPVSKKVCTAENKVDQQVSQQSEEEVAAANLFEKLVAKSGGEEDEFKNSKTYQSLFHLETKLEDNLFVRNVRYGIR